MSTGKMMTSARAKANRFVTLAHGGFLLIGIINTMLGPLLPFLSARWQLDDSQAGVVLLAQPTGAILGSLLSGSLIKRFGFARPLVGGFFLMSLSTTGLYFESWPVGLVAILGTGLSLGLTIPTINLLVSESNPERRAVALNIVNLIWGLGAAAGPLLISTLARVSNFTGAILFLAAVAAAIGIALIGMPARPFAAKEEGAGTNDSSGAARGAKLFLFLIGALIFINVGTESATGGWITTYVQRLGGGAPNAGANLSWALASSLFWSGLLVGRAAAPLVLRRLPETKTVLAGVFVAVGGLLVILLSEETTMVLAGAGLTGLGLAPIFPTTLAVFTQRFGAEAPQLTGLLFILAGLGAASFPWVVGQMSERYQGLRVGLLVPLAGACAMIVLQILIMSVVRKGKAERSGLIKHDFLKGNR